jgi:uncharacterized protein Usg
LPKGEVGLSLDAQSQSKQRQFGSTNVGMTPYEFYVSFVEGNYWDFRDQPDCVRRGFNAAIAASHMADHCYWYFHRHDSAKVSRFPKLNDYLDYLCQQTGGYFKDIRSIAVAFKHLYVADPNASIALGGAIEAVSLGAGDVAEAKGEYEEATERFTVVYTRKTGEQFELLPVLTKIVDFWSKEISSFDDDVPAVGETREAPE